MDENCHYESDLKKYFCIDVFPQNFKQMRRYVLVVGQSLSDVSCKCKVTASHISCILHVVLLLYLLKKFYLGIQILYLCR